LEKLEDLFGTRPFVVTPSATSAMPPWSSALQPTVRCHL